jgi:hypothetical protein
VRGLSLTGARSIERIEDVHMLEPADRRVTLNSLAGEALCFALDQQFFLLSTEEFDRFSDALARSVSENPRLRALLSARAPWEQRAKI